MPLFICAKCGCVENTALSTYWFRKSLKYCDELKEYQDKPLCSECGMSAKGKMIPGRWHGRFQKKLATDADRNHVKEDGLIH